MSVKNVNQRVNQTNYSANFERVFGKSSENKTGTYMWDAQSGCLVKIDDSTPRSVRDVIDPLMSKVRDTPPIPVQPKQIES